MIENRKKLFRCTPALTLWLVSVLVIFSLMETRILVEGRSHGKNELTVQMQGDQTKVTRQLFIDGTHEGDGHDGHDHHDHGHAVYNHDAEVSEIVTHEVIKDKPWGKVVGAGFVINIASLVGVLVLFCSLSGAAEFFKTKWVDISISSSAAGALLATACLLIMPESSVMLLETHTESDSHSDHEDHEGHTAEVSWKFGVSLLGGILLPMIVGAFIPHPKDENQVSDEKIHEATSFDTESCSKVSEPVSEEIDDDSELASVSCSDDGSQKCSNVTTFDIKECKESETEIVFRKTECIESGASSSLNNIVDKKDTQAVPAETRKPINWKLCSSILIGDAFHNFADGIFIGTAFMLCGTDLAVTVMIVTLYHEIAQELADFVLLTKHAGLSCFAALALNFISGLSVVFGGVLVLAMHLSPQAIGTILAAAAGVYINVAACECMPHVAQNLKTTGDHFISILTFVVGAIPIGLIMMNHSHCS